MKPIISKLTSSIFKILILCMFGASQSYAQTTAGILPNAKATFVDQNGKPLSSGKVYFYEPGTTTAKTTWQDINKVTANGNPVNLDAAGRALVWGDGSYRQQVYDRNNNLQWDQTTTISGSSSGGGTTIGDGLPVGIVLPASTVVAPTNYQFAYGQALSRSTYSDLYSALTITTTITCTGGNPTISNISDTTSLAVGAVLEAICVTGSPTIISKTSSTVTLSGNATVSTNTTGTFFLYGNGDATTTFNVPDYRGVALVGRCNMGGVSCSVLNSTYFSTNTNNTPSALNAIGGSQSRALLAANIPSLTSTNASQNITVSLPATQSSATISSASISSVQVANTGAGTFWVPWIGGSGWGNQNVSSGSNSISVTSTGTSGTAFSSISPVKTANYVIKVSPDINISTALISQLGGGQPNKLVGTDGTSTFGNVNLPSKLTLASYNLNFVAQACAGSTWANSIDISGAWTCTQPAFSDLTGSIAIGQIPNNLITNAKLAQEVANTLKGNATAGLATPTDVPMPSCSGANQAINWTSGTGPGCVTISGSSSGSLTPGGRLTVSSSVCVPTTDVAAAVSVFYAPCISPYVPIYNGTSVQGYNFTSSATDTVGLTLTLGANWTASTLYDVYVTLSGGNPILCTVAWSSSGAGTSARATALVIYTGMQTNAAAIAACRTTNVATIAVAQYQGTYLGTFLTNSSAGQVDLKFGSAAAGGGAACLCIWNMYNRADGAAVVQDTTASWGANTAATYEPLHAGGAGSGLNNRVTFVSGTGSDPIDAKISILLQTAAGQTGYVGLGLNATNAISTRCPALILSGAAAFQAPGSQPCMLYVTSGMNYLQGIEYANSTNTANVSFISTTPIAEGISARYNW